MLRQRKFPRYSLRHGDLGAFSNNAEYAEALERWARRAECLADMVWVGDEVSHLIACNHPMGRKVGHLVYAWQQWQGPELPPA